MHQRVADTLLIWKKLLSLIVEHFEGWGWKVSFVKNKKNVKLNSSIFRNIRNLCESEVFYFLSSKSCRLNFFILEARKFLFPKYKNFFHLVPESSTSRNIRKCYFLTVFWIYLGFLIYQGSEYASSSKYARVLNILLPKYKKGPFREV